MPTYILLLRVHSSGNFTVSFPDFPGCVASASTESEGWEKVRKALETHIQMMVRDGVALPEPADLNAIKANPANANANTYAVTWPSDIYRRFTRPEEDRQIAEILRAVAAIDLKTHPIYEAIKARHSGQWVGLDDHGIYTDADSVTLNGDGFAVSGDIGYAWDCNCHSQDVPDVEAVIVTGRFIRGRPVIENIAQEYPPLI